MPKKIKDSLPNGPDGYPLPKVGTAFTEAVKEVLSQYSDKKIKETEEFLRKLSQNGDL